MKGLKQVCALGLLLAACGVLGATAGASTIRSASNYGPNNDFSACSTSPIGNNCEGFNLNPDGSLAVVGTVNLGGIVNFNVYQFTFNDGTDPAAILDIINLGSISPGQTFTLTSALFGASDWANAQIFSCANGLTTPTDSLGTSLAGPCTPGLGFTGTYDFFSSNGGGSFSTLQGYNLSDLVLAIPVGTTTPTPEPASLALLGTGLVTLITLKRRKR